MTSRNVIPLSGPSLLLATLALMCQAIVAQQPEMTPRAPLSGDEIVRRSAAQLARESALEVRLRQQVNMFGQQLVGSGLYLQKMRPGSDHLLLRLELRLPVAGQMATLQHVCDGRFLWVRKSLPGETTLGRVDLVRLGSAVDGSGKKPLADSVGTWMALGGLPQLLAGLSHNFDFPAFAQGKLGETPAWMVTGRWKPKVLAELLPDQRERIQAGGEPDLLKLPKHLPANVRVVVRQDDLLPYRIEYRRAQDGTKDRRQPMVLLELVEIRRRDDLQNDHFVYHPGDQAVADYTGQYLKNLGLAP